jgi:DNA helicase-2/ATP-dependent DNA helicase PcrA
MDQGDSLEALDLARREVVEPDKRKTFPKTPTIAAVISRAVGADVSIEEALASRYPQFRSCARQLETIRALYEEHKRVNHRLDYDDLLSAAVRLLGDEGVLDEVSARLRHVLVDEYQDTNRLQARLLELLGSRAESVMAVGDDSQSIYSFRGADVANIMNFPRIFPGAGVIKLEENYRSVGAILSVTNDIIERCALGYEKRLFSNLEFGERPLLASVATERRQSAFVVECVRELQEKRVPLGEIAVLFRAGFHSFDLEAELSRNGIPFVKFGGMKLVESAHIKDVLAYLKALANPSDRLSWGRVFRLLPGVGPKTAAKAAEIVSLRGWEALPLALPSKGRKWSASFAELLRLFDDLRCGDLSAADQVDRVKRYYEPHLVATYDNFPKRLHELTSLADLAVPYDGLQAFLSDLALDPPASEVSAQGAGHRGDTLVLSTIHSAKGLEWDTVIVIWACEGRIPSPKSTAVPEELEEERRLLYVAATRAKKRLVFSAPREMLDRERGRVCTRLSRFISELPPDRFRHINLP